jgi:hypothetical protein
LGKKKKKKKKKKIFIIQAKEQFLLVAYSCLFYQTLQSFLKRILYRQSLGNIQNKDPLEKRSSYHIISLIQGNSRLLITRKNETTRLAKEDYKPAYL